MEDKIQALKKYLADGDSIYLSCRKAGISQQMHTDLLKRPDYKELIEFYKKMKKTTSFADAYIARLSRDKN